MTKSIQIENLIRTTQCC